MKPKVWMSWQFAPQYMARLEAEAEVVTGGDMAQLPGAIAAVPRLADGAFMDAAGPSLKLIARPGIGLDTVDLDAATERGILVCHTPDAPTESTAEHAVALLMAVAKRVVVGDMHLRGANLDRSEMVGTEIMGRTLGVVGYGRIGRRVAEICALGLKMKVLVYDPFIDLNQPTPAGVTLTKDFDSVFSQGDFVTVHTPLTPETRHSVGEREFRLMKKGSYLINASRGPVLDEAALIKVLQEGHLAGAGLDVFDPEPPEPDNPLLKMRNVVVTPHIASSTTTGLHAMFSGAVDQILQVIHGERPTWLANREVWPGRMG
jgi:D-3-phosphoglycerate dehydrogenase